MSDTTIYTKPATGKKWHIERSTWRTLCNRDCSFWFIWQHAELPPDSEICQQCQQINEAIQTGEGIPF